MPKPVLKGAPSTPIITQLGNLLRGGKPPKEVLSLKEGAIVKLLVKADKKPMPARTNEHGFIHVSSLIKGDCPRMLALKYRHDIHPNEFADGATRLMWEIGRAVERHIRQQFIDDLPAENVYGQWKCPCDTKEKPGRRREGFGEDKGKCHKCGHPAMIYVELDLWCDIWKVTGHPDFILVLDGIMYVVEIKSLTDSENANKSGDGFSTLDSPFVAHLLQATSYYKMMFKVAKRLGLQVGREIILLYASKMFNKFKHPYPYKEFHVDPLLYKPQIESLFKDGKAIYESVHSSLPPRLHVCTSMMDKVPCKCPLVHLCFSPDKPLIH